MYLNRSETDLSYLFFCFADVRSAVIVSYFKRFKSRGVAYCFQSYNCILTRIQGLGERNFDGVDQEGHAKRYCVEAIGRA